MIASGAGGIVAKDYLALGRNYQVPSVAPGDVGNAINDGMNDVDRFVSQDVPFLGQDPKVQKELKLEAKQLVATGVEHGLPGRGHFRAGPFHTPNGRHGWGEEPCGECEARDPVGSIAL